MVRLLTTHKIWLPVFVLLGSFSFAEMTEQEEAYQDLEATLAPLSESQMESVKDLYRRVNRQSILRQEVSPEPMFSSKVVDLQPGSSPIAVRLSPGYVSTLLFVDSTGKPWPISAYDVGDPSAFNIVWNNSDTHESSLSNTLLIQAMSMYKDGNLVVLLQGLNTPVILSLIPGQQEVDYRLDLQVPGHGPFAKPEDSVFNQGSNPVLNNVINNIAPPKSKALRVKGGNAKAWAFGDMMYVRTNLPVVSPAWVSSMKGASGTITAYELPKSPVILVMDNGRLRKLTVEGF